MNEEHTLCILKPDVIKRDIVEKVNSYIRDNGLKIIAQKNLQLSKEQAIQFYSIHRERPFFKDLIAFMTSGTVIVQVLCGENVIRRYREIMGATDPKQADKGTIRGDLAISIDENCVHGSDSPDNARNEVAFFFSGCELV